MSEFSITSAQLRSSEPVSGCSIVSYVKCRVNGDVVNQFAEEETSEAGQSDMQYAVRYRWLRSPETSETGQRHNCHIHQNRPGKYYCGFWKSEYSMWGYPFSDACHCSIECFRRHFHLHLQYYENVQTRRKQVADGERPLTRIPIARNGAVQILL